MNLLSFNIYRKFRLSRVKSLRNASNDLKRFVRYVAASFVAPIVISCITVAVEYTVENTDGKTTKPEIGMR